MPTFIVLLLPSLIGYKIFISANKERKFNAESKIFYYLMFVLFSNVFSVILSYLLFNLRDSVESIASNFPIFSIKYITVSIICNIILAVVFTFMKEVSFDVDIKKKDKIVHEKNHK